MSVEPQTFSDSDKDAVTHQSGRQIWIRTLPKSMGTVINEDVNGGFMVKMNELLIKE
jgi:hypothetical protein